MSYRNLFQFTIILLIIFVALLFSSCAKEDSTMNEVVKTEAQKKLDEADKIFSSGEFEQASGIYAEAFLLAEKSGNNSDKVEALSMMARCHLILERKDDGMPFIAKAESLAVDTEPLGWSRFMGVYGRFQWKDEKLKEATSTFETMYDYCLKHKLHSRAIDAAHMVAITGNPEQQIEWGLKGIKAAEEGKVTGWLGPLWNNLAWTYEEAGELEKSLDAYKKAKEYHYQHGSERNKIVADWAVAHSYRVNGNIDEAEKILPPVLEWFEKEKDIEFLGFTHQELGEIEFSKGNYKSASEHLKIAFRKFYLPEFLMCKS